MYEEVFKIKNNCSKKDKLKFYVVKHIILYLNF